MEFVREIKITIEVDTNKQTTTEQYDNYMDAIKEMLSRLSDDERMEALGDYCKYCGGDDPACQCSNDD